MKKLLTLTALGAILAAPAIAATQCIKSNPSNCTNQSSGYSNWTISCDNATYKGVAMLGSSDATVGDVADSLQWGDGSNPYYVDTGCWCKMTYPAESKWVYVGTAPGGYFTCADLCSNDYDLSLWNPTTAVTNFYLPNLISD